MNKLEILSVLLSPFIVAGFVIVFFSCFAHSGLLSPFWSGVFGLFFISFLPFSVVFYNVLKRRETINVDNRQDRTKYLLLGLFLYFLSALFFYYFQNHELFIFSLAYVFVTLFVAIINMYWKISIHSAGVAGPVTAVVYIFPVLFPLYLLTILVIYVRYRQEVHTLGQLIAGTLLSVIITFLVYYFIF